jgi:protocatechuate 3,4-dioxygenase beta subunit
MSTKTTFKRIALVAVAALGLGVLSVAPSSATTRLDNLLVTAGTISVTQGETGTATVALTFITNSATTDSVTVTASNVGKPSTATTTPDARFSIVDSTTGTLITRSGQQAAPTSLAFNATTGPQVVNHTFSLITTTSTTAGDYKYVFYTTSATGAEVALPQYLTFTVKSADKLASGATTSTLAAGVLTTNTENIDSTVVAPKSATATQAANILVRQKNGTSTANESFTAVVSGPAYVTSDASATGTRGTGSGITVKNGDYVHVWSTGTAGTAKITLTSISGLVLGTETVVFYGDVTKIAQTQATVKSVARSGGFSTTGAFTISATDVNGNPVPGRTVTGTSSNSNVISSVTVTEDATSPGDYLVDYTSSASSKSGDTATITFKTVDPAVTTTTAYLTTTAIVSVGGKVAKEVITLDKASYVAGEQMIITVTATDASGNPVYDGAATPALTSNVQIQGLDKLATTYTAGKADTQARSAVTGAVSNAYRAYAASNAGDFVIKATSSNTAGDIITVTGTVANTSADAATDAASEATDAANAATDAALAAADAADAATAAAQDASDAVAALSATVAKLVASLKAQITSLTNLVIKIQKKVKA